MISDYYDAILRCLSYFSCYNNLAQPLYHRLFLEIYKYVFSERIKFHWQMMNTDKWNNPNEQFVFCPAISSYISYILQLPIFNANSTVTFPWVLQYLLSEKCFSSCSVYSVRVLISQQEWILKGKVFLSISSPPLTTEASLQWTHRLTWMGAIILEIPTLCRKISFLPIIFCIKCSLNLVPYVSKNSTW